MMQVMGQELEILGLSSSFITKHFATMDKLLNLSGSQNPLLKKMSEQLDSSHL